MQNQEQAENIILYLQENKLSNEEIIEVLKYALRSVEKSVVQEQLNKPCKQIKMFET